MAAPLRVGILNDMADGPPGPVDHLAEHRQAQHLRLILGWIFVERRELPLVLLFEFLVGYPVAIHGRGNVGRVAAAAGPQQTQKRRKYEAPEEAHELYFSGARLMYPVRRDPLQQGLNRNERTRKPAR